MSVAAAVLVYVLFAVAVFALAKGWSRRMLRSKRDAFASALEAAGATKRGEASSAGLHRGEECEYELEGRTFFLKAHYVSRESVRINLRVAAGPLPVVSFSREGALERLGKAIQVTRTAELGAAAFDAAIAIDTLESDDAVLRTLLGGKAVRDAIVALLGLGFRVQLSSRGIEAYRKQAALRAVDSGGAVEAVRLLGAIAEELPAFDAARLTPERGSAVTATYLLLAAPVAIAAPVTAIVSKTGRELRITSWRPGRTEETVRALPAAFASLRPGDRVKVREHSGYFGWPWVEGVEPGDRVLAPEP